jgi:Ca-activated chloride channel homolog
MNRCWACPRLPLPALMLMLLCGGRTLAQNGTDRQPLPTFRSAVDLVTLHVTVTDREGRYLSDLDADEFTVREDGQQQEMRVFERGGLPLAVTLFLDVSSSMQHVFPRVQDAAIQFVKQLAPHDVASVVAFGTTVEMLQTFTADQAALESAVIRAKARGSTKLYNALYVGLKELARPDIADPDLPRRRVAVLLTDGIDTASLVRSEDVLDFAKRSGIAIYAIRLGGVVSGGDDTGEPQYVLNQLARQTGGRAFLSLADTQLRGVYSDIRMELSRQYAVGYVSNNSRRDGRFRYLSVQVVRPGAHARTRLGYFAPRADIDPHRRSRDQRDQ